MHHSFFSILLVSVLILSGCLSNKETVTTTDNTEAVTGNIQESVAVMTGDAQSGTISDEEVDAILGEIFEAIEGGLASPEQTGATEPLLESNDAMPQNDVLAPQQEISQPAPNDGTVQQ